jgi:uncharacterized membrane protein HdeD (DUF308 family)
MTAPDGKKELTIAALLLGFGFLVLPIAIYWVGQQVIGEYAPDAGVLDLAEAIWSDLLQLRPSAWTLVLAPYLMVQLVRLAWFTLRRAPL